jgi:hypothetical protein
MTLRSGRPVSRKPSMRKSCCPVVESVRAPITFQRRLCGPRMGERTPRCGVANVVKVYLA